MLDQTLVVVGAGPLPELLMRRGATTLADGLGMPLISLAVGDAPHAALQTLSVQPPSLVRLCGDPGRLGADGQSWLDAMGAWRMPTLLLASPLGDGAMPGTVPAYLALCESRRIPLLGLVQLGGDWQGQERRRDGLPWCGWLAEGSQPEAAMAVEAMLAVINQRVRSLSSASATAAVLPQAGAA